MAIKERRGRVKLRKGKWTRFTLPDSLYYDYPLGLSNPGTYAIFADGKCLYIGQGKNLAIRLKQHPIRGSLCSCGYFTPAGYAYKIDIVVRMERYNFERLAIEARFIERLKPMFNIGSAYKTWWGYKE